MIVLTFIFFLVEGPKKEDNRSIQKKTKQLVDIVEQRNALVELLDEERKRLVEQALLTPYFIAVLWSFTDLLSLLFLS